MGELSDEMLMAYADGELAPEVRAAVEAQLAADAGAREQLKVFEATRAPIAELYNKTLQEPVPGHLLKLILCDETPHAQDVRVRAAVKQEEARPSPIMAALNAVGRTLVGGPRLSMATAWSALVLAVAGGAGLYLVTTSHKGQELVTLQNGQIFASGPLQSALETAPSGKKILVGEVPDSSSAIKIILTFKNRNQAYCRQYDAATPKGGYAGIACRTGDGQWRLEIHMANTERPRPVAAEPSKPRTAPAGRAVSSVEAAVRKVIEGDALGLAEEKALISTNWRP